MVYTIAVVQNVSTKMRPRKKARLLLAVFVCTVIFIGTLFFFRKTTTGLSALAPRTVEGIASAETLIKDTDEDGLKDWEEQLYGTSPTLKDTDGDGTDDGQEVKEHRDPTKPGPDDTFNLKIDLQESAPHELLKKAAEVNLTHLFTQKIAQELDPATLTDKNAQKQLAAQLYASLSGLKQVPKYDEKAIPDASIQIIQGGDSESIRNYFNSIAALYEKHMSGVGAGEQDDLAILLDVLKKQKESQLASLNPLYDAAGRIRKDIALLSVPKDAVSFHKKELWYLEETARELDLLRKVKLDDPLLILTLASMRTDFKQEVTAFHTKEIPQWLKSKGISFLDTDKGKLLYPSL